MALDQETRDQLIEGVRRFVAERLRPLEAQVSADDAIPDAVVEEMKELGLFGLSIPEEYGGIGLSMAQECAVAYELGQTALAFRSVFGTNVGIGSQGILMDGTQEQKTEFLPRVASGELIMSFALTEPDAGSDAAAVKTRGERVKDAGGDYYVLNGTKRFITNAPRAGAFTLMARTDGDGASGISAFIVPSSLPGLSLGKPDKKMGQRGTKTCDVVLDNVRVPAENIIGGVPGKGFKTAMKVLDRGRLHVSALACGLAQRVLQESVAYAKERRQFGQRRLPARAGHAGRFPGGAVCRMVDGAGLCAAIRRQAGRPKRPGRKHAGVVREDVLYRDGGARRRPRRSSARWCGLHQRVQGRTFLSRRAAVALVRRHDADSAAHHRP